MVHLYSEVLLSHKKYILKYADKWTKLNKLVHLNMQTWPPKLSLIIQQWMSLNSLCRPVCAQTHHKKTASFCLQGPDFDGVQNRGSILCTNVFIKGIFVFGFFSWFLHVFLITYGEWLLSSMVFLLEHYDSQLALAEVTK